MRSLLLPLLLAACLPSFDAGEIPNCQASDPAVDCCVDDRECLNWFTDAFPYCENPGLQTGRCVECRVDEHCDMQSQCDLDPDVGSFCAPSSATR